MLSSYNKCSECNFGDIKEMAQLRTVSAYHSEPSVRFVDDDVRSPGHYVSDITFTIVCM